MFRIIRITQLSLKLKKYYNYSGSFLPPFHNSKAEERSRNVRSRQETRTERAKLMEIERRSNFNDLTLGGENVNRNKIRTSRRISIE